MVNHAQHIVLQGQHLDSEAALFAITMDYMVLQYQKYWELVARQFVHRQADSPHVEKDATFILYTKPPATSARK